MPAPCTRVGVEVFLIKYLGMSKQFADSMGEVQIEMVHKRKPDKCPHEVVVTFATKGIRDPVRSSAPHLAKLDKGVKLGWSTPRDP